MFPFATDTGRISSEAERLICGGDVSDIAEDSAGRGVSSSFSGLEDSGVRVPTLVSCVVS